MFINVLTSFWSPEYDHLFTDGRRSGVYSKNNWADKIEIGRAKCLNSDADIQLGESDTQYSIIMSCELLKK